MLHYVPRIGPQYILDWSNTNEEVGQHFQMLASNPTPFCFVLVVKGCLYDVPFLDLEQQTNIISLKAV